MTITPGEAVGPYRVIEQLGSGGMATVFKAYHPSLDRYVAIKVLHPAFKADPQFFERFKREARIVANLEHSNIIPVYDFSEHHGEPYLVMRFIEGDTLKPELEGQPMPAEEILRLMRPVCQGLSYAHKQGVLHRDIKPSNIMVTRDGSVFLTDFGLARMVQAGESTLSQDMMVGTPQYISPEQARGVSDLDGRSDIYSLGVVLFEMFTGRVPFRADTPFATIHDHIYTPLPLPSTINPDIDPAVERLLLKALAKDPADRFATTDEVLQGLEATLGPQIATASPVAAPEVPAVGDQPPEKRGLPWWTWAAGAALILCIVGALVAGLLLFRARNRTVPPPGSRPSSGPVADGDQPAGAESDQPDNPPSQQDEPQPDIAGRQEAVELTKQAEQAMRQDRFDEASGLYKQAIAADPHHLPAYFGLSQARRRSGDPVGSIAALKEAVVNNPDNAEALMRLGEAQLSLAENPKAALESFEQAARLQPDDAGPYAGQAISLLAMDRDEAAKEAIDEALALDQTNPGAHLANAFYLAKQGDRRAALHEVEQVLRNRNASPFFKERARQLQEKILGN